MTAYLVDTAIDMARLVAVLAAVAAVLAVVIGPRRAGRVLHAVIAVTRRHAPRWIVVVLNVALAIPGPVDEAIVLAIIGVMVWRMPALRAAMVTAVRAAWAAPVTRRGGCRPQRATLAAAAVVAVLAIAPAVIAAPAAQAASGAASIIIGHARHHHGHH